MTTMGVADTCIIYQYQKIHPSGIDNYCASNAHSITLSSSTAFTSICSRPGPASESPTISSASRAHA